MRPAAVSSEKAKLRTTKLSPLPILFRQSRTFVYLRFSSKVVELIEDVVRNYAASLVNIHFSVSKAETLIEEGLRERSTTPRKQYWAAVFLFKWI